MTDKFQYTNEANPHVERARKMIKDHPELKELMHNYPLTSVIGTLILILQWGIAYALATNESPLWLILVVAFVVGAFAHHAIFVINHEATHNLIFKKTLPNRLFAMLTDLSMALPTSQGFRIFHIYHHTYLSEYDLDADLASHTEAKLVGNSWWRKSLWYLGFLIVEAFRPGRLKKIKLFDGWVLANILTVLTANILIFIYVGPSALFYLLFSSMFAVGLHPCGARWIQEHYVFRPGQWTYSYYGPLNKLALNVGYHVEHHDLLNIPWVNLPKMNKIANEYYVDWYAHHSWTKLLLTFLFDKNLDLYSRIVKRKSKSTAV